MGGKFSNVANRTKEVRLLKSFLARLTSAERYVVSQRLAKGTHTEPVVCPHSIPNVPIGAMPCSVGGSVALHSDLIG